MADKAVVKTRSESERKEPAARRYAAPVPSLRAKGQSESHPAAPTAAVKRGLCSFQAKVNNSLTLGKWKRSIEGFHVNETTRRQAGFNKTGRIGQPRGGETILGLWWTE